ncbi:MAG: carbon-nitrogen hydrolase family protein [Gemmatimonadota bacterium]|nr:carbon-nitrogen hydrolase family protein [Gemmatimonadota bacterium]
MNSEGPVRLAVCEAPTGMMPGDASWKNLASDAAACKSDIFLLNEIPFGPWLSARPEPQFDDLVAVQRLHENPPYSDLGAQVVLGSHPVFEDSTNSSINEGFAWSEADGMMSTHTKQFFPNEEGWYETMWFDRGEQRFDMIEVGGLSVGFLICTDIMFNEWARYYGRQGADLIVVPRATGVSTLGRWKAAVQMAAIVSGCYVASSNRAGEEEGIVFGGLGWIVDPSGVVIAETSADDQVVAADLYRSVSAHAKREYPCYVEDIPISDAVSLYDE